MQSVVLRWVNPTRQPVKSVMMERKILLTQCWLAFFRCGREWVVCNVHNDADLFMHIETIRHYRKLVSYCARLKIVSNLLMLTFVTSKQMLNTQSLFATTHIHIADIQYWFATYYHLYPGVFLLLNCWSTAIHDYRMRNIPALFQTPASCRPFMACRSFHKILVNIARLPD